MFSRTYDDAFRVTTESVNAGYTVAYAYDDDDQLTEVGDELLFPDATNGLLTGTALSNVTSGMSYNDVGEIDRMAYADSSSTFYDAGSRDDVGRLTTKVETPLSSTETRCYEYTNTTHPAGWSRSTTIRTAPVASGRCSRSTTMTPTATASTR